MNDKNELVLCLYKYVFYYFTLHDSMYSWVSECLILNSNYTNNLETEYFRICGSTCQPHFEFIYRPKTLVTIPYFDYENYRVIFKNSLWFLFSMDLTC